MSEATAARRGEQLFESEQWVARIEDWSPPRRFVDLQLRGPYALWHHTHTFEEVDGGTRLGDRVRYRLPLGALGQAVAGDFVRRDVRTIFEYRRQAIESFFRD